jgi:hypothetical protein
MPGLMPGVRVSMWVAMASGMRASTATVHDHLQISRT